LNCVWIWALAVPGEAAVWRLIYDIKPGLADYYRWIEKYNQD
jgi:hypothetical protein